MGNLNSLTCTEILTRIHRKNTAPEVGLRRDKRRDVRSREHQIDGMVDLPKAARVAHILQRAKASTI